MNPEMHTHTRERLLMDAGWKFHYYQAWWSNRTVLHLFPHWNWPGRDGDVIAVWVHSNCDEVELFLNGTTLGRQTVQKARHLEWRVPYHPGALTARGWKQGQHVATACVETSGPPAGIRLMPDRTVLRADGEDATVVNVAVLDAQGRVVPVADNVISFAAGSHARILGIGNGDPSSHEPDKTSSHRVFNGLCQVVLQATRDAGAIQFEARSPGLAPARIELTAEPAMAGGMG